jgi:hypothetical protein
MISDNLNWDDGYAMCRLLTSDDDGGLEWRWRKRQWKAKRPAEELLRSACAALGLEKTAIWPFR